MAGNKDLKMGEVTTDDDLNIPDFEFDPPPVDDKRSVVTKARDGVAKGATAAVRSPTTYAKMVKHALPREYGEAFDVADSVSGTIKDTYEQAVKEIRPVANDLAKSVDKLVPESAKRTKGALKRIQDWAKGDEVNSGPSEEAQRNANTELELSRIFKFQMEEQLKKDADSDAKDTMSEAIGQVRHKDQMAALNSAANSLNNLVQYNSRITSAYQRKHLELQYRMYYVQTDLLKEARLNTGFMKARLDSIVKNTAMPEYVKLRLSERFKENLRNKFVGDVTGGFFGKRGDFFKNFAENISKEVYKGVDTFKQAAGAAAMGADTVNTMNEMGMGPKVSATEMAGEAIGESMIQSFAKKIGTKTGGFVGKNKYVRRGAQSLNGILNDTPAMANEFVFKDFSDKEDDGTLKKSKNVVARMLQGFIQAGMPSGGSNKLDTDGFGTGRGDAIFNNFTNKSITEVIPGYLARILRELQVTRTGDQNTSTVTYDFVRNTFSTDRKIAKDIKETIVPENTKQSTAYAFDELIDGMEGAKDLTPEEKKALAQVIMLRRSSDRMVDARALSKISTFQGGPADASAQKLSAMFSQHFQVDGEGKHTTDEGRIKEAEFRSKARSFGDTIANSNEYAQNLINNGQLDLLRASGYFDEKSGELDKKKIFAAATEKIGEVPSDVNLKTNIKQLSPTGALDAMSKIPVSGWTYKKDSAHYDGQQHVGPMAQDVKAKLGDDFAPGGKKIDLINLNGLAMSSIQGLNDKFNSFTDKFKGMFKDEQKPKYTTEELLTRIDENTHAIAAMMTAGGSGLPESRIGGNNNSFYRRLFKSFKLGRFEDHKMDNSAVARMSRIAKESWGLGADLGNRAMTDIRNINRAGIGAIRRMGTFAKENIIQPGYAKGKQLFSDARTSASQSWDLYVEGEVSPRLTKAKLEAGHYRDKATGAFIKSLGDIKGAVVDIDGNLVISKKELKKSFIRINSSMGQKIVRLGDTIFKILKETVNDTIDTYKTVGNIVFDKAKQALTYGLNLLDEPRDLYVEGETKPRLHAVLMKAGHYFLKKDGKPIMRPSDITDEVIDKEGNIIVSADDLVKGLKDIHGNVPVKPMKLLLGAGIGLARSAAGVLRDLFNSGVNKMKNLGDIGSNIGQSMTRLLEKISGGAGNKETVSVLKEIRDILDKRLPENKKVVGDLDGDGDRDASVQDKLKQEKERLEDEKADRKDEIQDDIRDPANPTKYKTRNTFDIIAEKIGGLFGGGDGPDVDIEVDGNGRKGRRRGRRGAMRRAGRAIGGSKVGRAVGGLASRAGALIGMGGGAAAGGGLASAGAGAGSAIGGAAGGLAGSALSLAGKGLLGAGRLALGGTGMLLRGGVMAAQMLAPVAGAIISAALSPIGLTVIGTAAVGYGAYKLYKYLSKKDYKDISLLRMIQYGAGAGDQEWHQKLNALEKLMEKAVTYDGDGKPDFDDKKIDAKEVRDIFDLSESDGGHLDRFTRWFGQRFKPVYLVHMAALKMFGGSAGKSLDEIEKLDPEIRLKMLDKVAMPNGPWGVDDLPFKETSKTKVTGSAVAEMVEMARTELGKILKDKNGKGLGDAKDLVTSKGVLGAAAKFQADPKQEGGTSIVSNEAVAKEEYEAADAANKVKYGAFAPKLKTPPTTITSTLGKAAIGGSLTALEAVRYRSYGLEKFTANQVVSLRALEELTLKQTYFPAGKNAEWTGKVPEILRQSRQYFGFGFTDHDMNKNWTTWFIARFMPVWMDFATAVNRATSSDKILESERNLKPDEALVVAQAMIGNVNAWSVQISPWKDIKLTTDTKLTDENMDFLRKTAKDYELTSQKAGKTGTTDPNAGTKALQMTTNGTRTEEQLDKDIDQYRKESQQRQKEYLASLGGDTQDNASGSEETEKAPPATTISASARASLSGVPNNAGGELKDGASGLQYLQLGSNVNIDGLNPQLRKLVLGMAQEYGEMTGKKIGVNSGYRSYDQQAALHKQDPKKAAKPGGSLHEAGLALDIDSKTANELDKLGLMRKYGLTRPVGGEPWHVEPAGIQKDPVGYKKAPNTAAQAIIDGVGKGGGGWGTKDGAAKYTRNPDQAKELLATKDSPTSVADYVKPVATDGSASAPQGSGKTTTQDMAKKAVIKGIDGGTGTDGGVSVPEGSKDSYAKMPQGKGKGWNDMKGVIEEASKATGVDIKKMATVAAIESGFNPNAKASTSSATGLYQFTSGTWKDMMNKYGAGLSIDPNTPPTDPRANALLAGMFMKENESALKKVKGDVNNTDLYMAHFLGAGGAKKFLTMDDNAIPSNTMESAAASNKNIFYDKNGRPRSKAEIYDLMNNKVNKALDKHGVDLGGTVVANAASNPNAGVDIAKGGIQRVSYQGSTAQTRDFQNNSGLYKPTENKAPVVAGPLPAAIAPQPVVMPAAPKPQQSFSQMLPSREEAVRNAKAAQIDESRQVMMKTVSSLENVLQNSLTAQQTTASNTGTMVQILQAAIDSLTNGSKQNGAKNETPPKVETPSGNGVKSYRPDRTAQLVSPSPVTLKRTV